MVAVGAPGRETTLTTQSPRVLTPSGAIALFVPVALVSLLIASAFAWFGAWPVLPFAGLELAAVALGLRACAGIGRDFERITIAPGGVVVEVIRGERRETHHFHRHWAQIVFVPAGQGDRRRLVIRSHGREIELGRRISHCQQVALAQALRRQLAAT